MSVWILEEIIDSFYRVTEIKGVFATAELAMASVPDRVFEHETQFAPNPEGYYQSEETSEPLGNELILSCHEVTS